MKGLSVFLTMVLFVLATRLPQWLHTKDLLPEQTTASRAEKVDAAKLAADKHLQPTLKI